MNQPPVWYRVFGAVLYTAMPIAGCLAGFKYIDYWKEQRLQRIEAEAQRLADAERRHAEAELETQDAADGAFGKRF